MRNQTRGVTATGTLTIAVQNHVPTVAPITITMHPNSTTLVDVLAHATDLNGDPLTITQAHSTYGTVTISNNRLHYTTPSMYPFEEPITYTISDGYGGLREGTVVVQGLRYQLFLPYTSK
ncbi:Ig-like domain-containing protein [Herpetosiphon gulosus]|uniref:Uncharacterized protein n=1 Tax=Herpetosiphon gulosus TaxID=1973496 RepID=A0ABP9WVW8_9CHLR